MTRKRFDQYVKAGTAGLVRQTDKPAEQVVRDIDADGNMAGDGLAPDGQHSALRVLNRAGWLAIPEDRETHRTRSPDTRPLLTYLPIGAVALVIVSIGISASLGGPTWSVLAPVGVSVLLAGVSWRFSASLHLAWCSAVSSAGTRPAPMNLEPGQVSPEWPEPERAGRPARLRRQVRLRFRAWSWNFRQRLAWPELGGLDAERLVREFLLLATAVSLIWLVWVRPGPRQYGLVIAVTLALAIPKPRWLKRHTAEFAHRVLAPSARYFMNRAGVLARMLRLWHRIPSAARARAGLLLLLNTVITLALIDTAQLSFGLWAIHTKIAFVVMCVVGILLLEFGLSPAPADKFQLSRNYLLPPEAAEEDPADRSGRNGRAQGRRRADKTDKRSAGRERSPVRLAAPKVEKALGSLQRRFPVLRGKIRAGVAAGAVLLTVGWIGFAHPGPLPTIAVLVAGAATLSVLEVDRHRAITMLLAVALGTASVDYLSWRFAVTNWQGWWIAVPLLFAEVLGAIHVIGFQVTVWPWPRPVVEPSEDPARHEVFMLVPTFNEGTAILRPTLEGCITSRQKYLAQYPDGRVTIVVCNDGRAGKYPRWAEIDVLAQELGVRCVTRTSGGGAKAGNIENARQECSINGPAFMAIFDADQVPEPDFLLKTIPPFADPTVGWVQTGQYYANRNNPVSRWADDQQSMFYNLLCPGKAALNAAFICGTNVVLRAAALDEIGGLPQDSVTEDFAASINLHPRWRSIYLTDVLATGLGPLDIPSYLKQQGRWALGTLAVFRGHWRDILLPKRNGLRFGQRVQYFLAGTHYLCGLRDLIYLVSPALFIFTGVPAVRTATLNQYLLHFLPYGMLGIGGMWYSARGVTGLRGVIIGFGSSPALIGSLAAVIMHRMKPFAVTSKERQGRLSLKYLGIYVVALLFCLTALAWATQVKGRQATSMFISMLWVVYSLLLLGSFLWLAYKDVRVHEAAQRSSHAGITAKSPYRSKLLVGKRGIRPALNLGAAALVASPLLLGARLASLPVFSIPATPFAITQQQANARFTGVSLPVQLLASAPPVLERNLGVNFSIIGRTQNISDRFDTAWADELAAQGARPWIDLELGGFGPNHKPPLTANLPAIFNGVDDSALARWAAEIRDYRKPVYLTVLLQVDKNWAVSSGVANGGIPEDVPKAWMHIQSVFRAAGANNVVWVWAPADPIHDQQFAPPPSTIGAVLQAFIMYPGTRWGNPQQILRNLAERYPGKPLFIDVSVSGPADQKAAWLARLGQAVDDSSQVYALLYHEGGPLLKPTPAQEKSWSEASDPQSLATWRHIVTTLHAAGSHGNLCRTAGRCPDLSGARTPPLEALAGLPYPGPAGGGFPGHAAQHGLPG